MPEDAASLVVPDQGTTVTHGPEGKPKEFSAPGIGGDLVRRAERTVLTPHSLFIQQEGEPLSNPDQQPPFPDLEEVLRRR
jgi:hypothetical protein